MNLFAWVVELTSTRLDKKKRVVAALLPLALAFAACRIPALPLCAGRV